MSTYKTAIGAAATPEMSKPAKLYSVQARQLQELFPAWSNDDLQSLLSEVAGDVELAATRISDGRAEQWGAVTRKKDKKGPGHVSKDSFSSSRGDFRGGRGGARGGRGGPTRGGAAPRARGGISRGAAPTNGHTPAAPAPPSNVNAWADGPPSSDKTTDAAVAWGTDSSDAAPAANNWTEQVDTPSATATPSSWGGTSNASTWGADTDVNGSSASLAVPQPKVSKTPMTSKMSWAQIARPQEKPIPPPPAPAPIAPPPTISPAVPEPAPQEAGWEDPTTVQPPSWEEEAPIIKPSTSAADVWGSTVNEPPEEPQQEQQQVHEPQVEETSAPEPSEESTAPPSEPEPAPPVASPSPSLKPAGAVRPAAGSHRSSARYKTIDQPVVMPSSFGSGIEKVGMQFGSLSLGGESSFDNSAEPEPTPEPQSPPAPQVSAAAHHEPPPAASVPPSSASLGSALFQGIPQQASPQVPLQHTLPTSVSQPVVSQTPKVVPLAEALAAQPAPISPGMQQELNHLTPQQQAYMQQHMAGGYIPPHLQQIQQQQQHQQQQQQQQQHQQQQQQQHLPQQTHAQHQYAQHGLPTHIDPSQQQSTPQHQPTSAHSSYFRNEPTPAASSPYFHTPTPPAGQPQDTPYGAFGQLGGQGQHQQGSHLAGFGQQDYGHADNQRGFYDTYQQSAFGNRNVLGHEDVKGLPGAPQQPPSGALPPSAGQSAQHAAQGQGQQQPPPAAGPQGQQGYPPPLPYYYPYPQNQYYGAPYNSGYNVAPPFVKYPAMFPGPPGPGNAPAPGQQGQGGLGVKGQAQAQGQGGGYGPAQGLYQQGGYDDYAQPQGHGAHQQPQHALGLGQGGGAEYGKPLYGGGAQGFMGLGGQGGGAGGPQAGGGQRGGSPETSYKPYSKDVGVGAARGGGVQQGQGQGQQQGQGQGQGGPQGQGFYGGNRFGGVGGAGVGGVGAGGAGPQQSAHHQQGPQGHLGYSQAQNEFYPYRGGQQQYWQ
ncbi:hypothetical protein C8R46DRAFT_1194293 [Mycena filopes]|nr:hypothetical protein C8R46DRAFT_1194293 [Mycena filopes]